MDGRILRQLSGKPAQVLNERPSEDRHSRHHSDLGLDRLIGNAESSADGAGDCVETICVRVDAMVFVHQ